MRGERLRLRIAYAGVPASGLKIGANKHGERTFFSDNWPDKGRHWLPTVDHVYDKATASMVVTAPAHYQVVSNGLLVEETDLPDGRRRTHWRQSVPIAPWLYTLGVARFAVQHVDTFDGKAIQTWVYAKDRDAGFHDFAVPTRDALAFYSERVGPFSYEKLANVQSNSVSGGMEAASAIFYSEGSVTGTRSERWRNVIIHEVAHQWFGNAVTEYDWDDVWLSEGFATYFTLLFIEHAYGRDAFLRGLEDSRQRVIAFDREHPDYRIVHDNLDDMSKVTTGQIYQKGAWVLHMLRGLVGDEAFWTGIRSYYRAHKDGHATTADFRAEMERASGRDLGPVLRAVAHAGRARAPGRHLAVPPGHARPWWCGSRSATRRGSSRCRCRWPSTRRGAPRRRSPPCSWTRQRTSSRLRARVPVRVVLDPQHLVLMEADVHRGALSGRVTAARWTRDSTPSCFIAASISSGVLARKAVKFSMPSFVTSTVSSIRT